MAQMTVLQLPPWILGQGPQQLLVDRARLSRKVEALRPFEVESFD